VRIRAPPTPRPARTARNAGTAATEINTVVAKGAQGQDAVIATSTRLAAARVGLPVEVLDSRTVGMAQGLGVQAAVAAAADGSTAAEVREFAEQRLARTRVYFYVPSLEQLRRGGRIGAAASLWGTMLAIKPILAVEDGRVVPLEKVRSAAKAVAARVGISPTLTIRAKLAMRMFDSLR